MTETLELSAVSSITTFVETHTPTEKFKSKDFRLRLQQEFLLRCRKNPSYSLRAYARSLGIEASPLSAILRGKRPLTLKSREKLGLALGLNLEEIKSYQNEPERQSTDYQQIAIDHYSIISDWYHYAILELIRVESFRADPQYVAKALGISPTEVQSAIERLRRVGLLKIGKNGKWIDTSLNGFATNIEDDRTSSASMKLQKQVFEMAASAISEVSVEKRNHTSMTMAIHPDDLPEAKKRIRKFRRELCDFFEKNNRPQTVYQLGIALYPLTKFEELK